MNCRNKETKTEPQTIVVHQKNVATQEKEHKTLAMPHKTDPEI